MSRKLLVALLLSATLCLQIYCGQASGNKPQSSTASASGTFSFPTDKNALQFHGAGGVSAAGHAAPAQPEDTKDDSSSVTERHIRQIEQGTTFVFGANHPPFLLTLEKLMDFCKAPGLSIAVIDQYRIAWTKGYGVTEAGSSTPVTPRTLFMAGSIAKTPSAVAALRLVQEGKLALDEDVNKKLRSWKVPDNEFTAKEKVTLRRILSHTAGTTVHGFAGYAVDEPRPTLVQVLNGEKPANTPPVLVDVIPGSKWRYSGGGVLIEQQLLVDVTGKSFPDVMRETVFDKLGMQDSTYEQPLPPQRAAMAASGTYASGKTVPGGWHVYPEMAAGGLWTTPTDLAKFAIEIALSRQGKSSRILSQSMSREMLTPQVEQVGEIALGNREHIDRMGLGFFLGDASRPDLFGHIGDDEGFQAMLMMFADSGQGVVIMANSEYGIAIGDYLLANVAREYGWKEYVPSVRPGIIAPALLLTLSNEHGVAAAMEAFRHLKSAPVPGVVLDQETLIGLGYALLARHRLTDAIEVLKQEVADYPEYWNAYDTLAEMYMNAGNKQLAIQNYAKSVALNPNNQSGIRALKKLQAE